jgi:hypothetical protein
MCECNLSLHARRVAVCLLGASQHHDWVFLLRLEMEQKFRNADLYNVLPRILGPLSYTYLNLLSGVDEVSGQSWQLITAILLMMKVIVWHFVSNSRKVMTALFVVKLPTNYCHVDLSAISLTFLCVRTYNLWLGCWDRIYHSICPWQHFWGIIFTTLGSSLLILL